MKQIIKIGLGIAGFALLLAVAVISYQTLSKQIKPDDRIGASEGQKERETGSEAESAEKQMGPDFTVTDSEGNSVKLSELVANGKPIVLNFWASWCSPCKSEMPEFDTVYQELGDDVQFMMVNLTDGQRETTEIAAQYIGEQGFSFPVYFDTAGEGAYAYEIRSIPTTYFIDKDGYVITGARGAINEETLRKGISMIQ